MLGTDGDLSEKVLGFVFLIRNIRATPVGNGVEGGQVIAVADLPHAGKTVKSPRMGRIRLERNHLKKVILGRFF